MKKQRIWSSRGLQAIVSLAIFAVLALLAGPALAAVPVTMTQQGRILDGDKPMTGDQELEFTLYDAESGGDILWSDHVQVDLGDDGVYTAHLGGSDNPIDATVLQEGEVFLELSVDGDAFSRLAMTSVPFAAISQTAEVAQSVVDGGVTAQALASGAVTSEAVDSLSWDKITDVPDELTDSSDTLAELTCSSDQIAIYNGSSWSCANQQDTTYSGSDFALSDQSCSGSQVAVGFGSNGTLDCVDQQDTTYTGSDFALSDQSCSGSQVAVGFSTNGTVNCVDQQDTTYTGSDFALSNQSCSGDQVAVGVNTDGTFNCATQQDTTYSAGTGLELSSNQFSADSGYFDANYLQSGGSIDVAGNINADGYVQVNANQSSSNSYLYFRGTSITDNDPRFYHASFGNSFNFRGIDGVELGTTTDPTNLEVTGDTDLQANAEVGNNLDVGANIDVGNDFTFGGDLARMTYLTFSNRLQFSDFGYEIEELWTFPNFTVSGDLEVTGAKNFIQPHPHDPSRQINYIAQEGGESGVYWRGSAVTQDGEAIIDLPQHFSAVATEEDLTATVTPRGRWAPLYVDHVSPRHVVVALDDSFDIDEDVEFDFHVQGVRSGLEDRGGIKPNTSFVPANYGVTENLELVESPQPHIEALMIENGTLNPDGTVNEQTAQEMGWDLTPR